MAKKSVLDVVAKFVGVDKISPAFRNMTKSSMDFTKKTVMGFQLIERAEKKMMIGLKKVTKQLGTFGLVLGATALLSVVGMAINKFATFEQANANLSSIMRDATIPQLKALQDDAKRLGAVTAKSATEVVGLQEAYARLGFPTQDILNMTEATISGSVAMNAGLSETAELAGAVINSFTNLSSIDTKDIMNQMVAATQSTALSFEKLQTGLPNVAKAADASGIPFNKLLALLGKLSDAGIDASMSSTALRNIFIESAAQGLPYDKILDKIIKNQDKLTKSNTEFGKRAALSGIVLADTIKETDKLADSILNSGNAAEDAAKKQLNTLNGRITLLNSAYEGFILSLDDGTGAYSDTIKSVVEVATEMLSLASGTEKASWTLNEAEKSTRRMANVGMFLVKTLFLGIKAFVLYKAIMLVAKGVMFAYNVVLGINVALQKKSIFALKGNAVAMGVYRAAMIAATAANWLFRASNPFGWISIAIALLIPFVKQLYKHFDKVIKAFKNGGFVEGIKMAGKALLDTLLKPVKWLLQALSNIPGLSFLRDTASSLTFLKPESKGAAVPVDYTAQDQSILTPEIIMERNRVTRDEHIEKQMLAIKIESDKNIETTQQGEFSVVLGDTME